MVEVVLDGEGVGLEALEPFGEFLGALDELADLAHEGSCGRVLVGDLDAEIQEDELADVFLVGESGVPEDGEFGVEDVPGRTVLLRFWSADVVEGVVAVDLAN